MPSTKYYSGFLGLILIPDTETAKQAEKLANQYLPNSEYRIVSKQAHITLYQARFIQKIPSDFIEDLLLHLRHTLEGQTLTLERLAPYREYLFWEVSSHITFLTLAHYAACSLGAFFEEPAAESSSSLKRRNDPITFFGHSLVGTHYLPHLTLGADATPLSQKPLSLPHEMTIKRVVLARMGTKGRLEKILV